MRQGSGGWSLSATKCIERTRREHEDLLAEFNSLMAGVEATLEATGMAIRRMTHDDIFLEVKRALHPLGNDTLPYRPAENLSGTRAPAARWPTSTSRMSSDDYLKIGGLLYSWITLKDLPDATFPGILRELVAHGLSAGRQRGGRRCPTRRKAIKQYKSRLRKMMAAQQDFNGGFRINVDAQVAERQLSRGPPGPDLKLAEVLPDEPDRRGPHFEASAQPVRAGRGGAHLADRRQRVLHAHRPDERSTGDSGDACSEAAVLRRPAGNGEVKTSGNSTC